MTPEQKSLVQTSFDQVLPIADVAANLFYTRLFELDPTLRPMFRGDMTEQGRKLMDMLRVAVKGLDKLDALLPALRKLGERHVNYGVTAEHYTIVGSALIWTLQQGLGEAFTPAVEAAWVEVYTILTSVMQEATLQLV